MRQSPVFSMITQTENGLWLLTRFLRRKLVRCSIDVYVDIVFPGDRAPCGQYQSRPCVSLPDVYGKGDLHYAV